MFELIIRKADSYWNVISKPKQCKAMHLTAIFMVVCNLKKQVTRNQKLLLAMKLSVFLLLTTFMTASARSDAQTVSIDVKNVSLDKVLSEIRKQAGYEFI